MEDIFPALEFNAAGDDDDNLTMAA